jgi:hypothetical protein
MVIHRSLQRAFGAPVCEPSPTASKDGGGRKDLSTNMNFWISFDFRAQGTTKDRPYENRRVLRQNLDLGREKGSRTPKVRSSRRAAPAFDNQPRFLDDSFLFSNPSRGIS